MPEGEQFLGNRNDLRTRLSLGVNFFHKIKIGGKFLVNFSGKSKPINVSSFKLK